MMKNIFISILSILVVTICFTQSSDTILYRSENILLTQHQGTGLFNLVVEDKEYNDLKFVKLISTYFQILDNDNQIYYVGLDGERKKEINERLRWCGTVPHYTLSIKNSGDHFEIYEDETYYDFHNEKPAEKKRMIKIEDADSVLFINGKNKFNFTSNFDADPTAIDPRMLILIKNGKSFIEVNPELKFDSIDFTNYRHSITTKKNNLFGVLGIVDPKYKRIEGFIYYLAEAEKTNGEIVYLDYEGNEYNIDNNRKR